MLSALLHTTTGLSGLEKKENKFSGRERKGKNIPQKNHLKYSWLLFQVLIRVICHHILFLHPIHTPVCKQHLVLDSSSQTKHDTSQQIPGHLSCMEQVCSCRNQQNCTSSQPLLLTGHNWSSVQCSLLLGNYSIKETGRKVKSVSSQLWLSSLPLYQEQCRWEAILQIQLRYVELNIFHLRITHHRRETCLDNTHDSS